mmetsp:Transcript_48110/g.138151  ORF Transcript_48110/g.138151 Transcript_48110/m.138151 type:complete len:207 (+) Transcript_48110:72-692(+)
MHHVLAGDGSMKASAPMDSTVVGQEVDIRHGVPEGFLKHSVGRGQEGSHEAAVAGCAEHVHLLRQLPAGLRPVRLTEVLEHELRRHVAVARPGHGRDEAGFTQQRPREHDLILDGSMGQGLAHHGARVAVRARRVRMLHQQGRELLSLLRGAVLQDVLHDIVPVGVLGESHGVNHQCFDQLLHLRCRAMLDQPFHDATTVAVACGL